VILTARVLVSSQHSGINRKTTTASKDTPEVVLEKFCNDFLAESSVNGFQLAVMKNGSLVFSKGYGYADIQNRTTVTSDTQFQIGSISKSVTSAALVRLVKERKLDLDKPIETYLPSLHFTYPVTTRQLAGHIAGIRHYRDGDTDDLVRKHHYNSAVEALSVVEKDTLLFKPGEKFHYSSFGWNIIGAIIEKTSGQRYLDYLRDNIVPAFGLNHTAGLENGKHIEGLSKRYLVTGEPFDAEDVSYKYPSGGLISNAEDLVAFGCGMLAEKNDTVAPGVFAPMQLNNGEKTNYGLGWNIGKDPNGHRIFFHTGNLINGSGFLVLYPDDNIVAAFLCNSPEGLGFDLQKAVSLFY
jgi:CubicO group peptidase (beta-lactamase class C family)